MMKMFEKLNNCRVPYFLSLLLLLGACTGIELSKPTRLSVEAVDLSMTGVTVNVILTGDLPSRCRIAAPVLKKNFDAAAASDEFLRAYLDSVGCDTVSLPAAVKYDDLQASSEYFSIVEWTGAGDQVNYKVEHFKTLSSAELNLSLTLEGYTWKKGDRAGVVSYDRIETSNANVKAEFGFSVSQSEAIFLPSADLEMPKLGRERFYVYYPYDGNARLEEADFCIHSLVPETQDGQASRDVLHSWAISEVTNASTSIPVTLSEALCRLDVTINLSEDEYLGYGLRKMSIFDSKHNAAFSGEFAVDPEKEVVKAVSGKSNSSVTAVNDSLFLDGEGKMSFTVIPGDYRECDIIFQIYLENASGETLIVPIKYGGDSLDLKPGDIMAVKIESLEASEDPYPWFEFNDYRDFLGSVAYGAQNTVCVEAGTSVTFDVKARGDILQAKVPKYYGIMLAGNNKNSKIISIAGSSEDNPSQIWEIPADYKITVDCEGGETSSSFGVVAIYETEEKARNREALWSFMIWKYESGDVIQGVSYDGVKDKKGMPYIFMDRALGARRSISAALQRDDRKAGEGAAYFNWGRKDPFPWGSDAPSHYTGQIYTEPDGLQYAIAHPNMKLGKVADSPRSREGWYDGMRQDLWGAENKTAGESGAKGLVGHKTIYDPCPEGYRVPDYDALTLIDGKKKLAEIEFASGDNRYGSQHSSSPKHLEMTCPFYDMSAFAIKKTDGEYDYWLYHGLMWANGNLGGCKDATRNCYRYWANTNRMSSERRGMMISGCYMGSGSWGTAGQDQMSCASPVRCQKEN